MTNGQKKTGWYRYQSVEELLIHYTMRFVSINSNGTFNTVHTADVARYALLGRMKGLSKFIDHYASILLSVSFYIVSHCSSYQWKLFLCSYLQEITGNCGMDMMVATDSRIRLKGISNMSNIVLLVVDVQNALINEHPYNEQTVIENISKLILIARDNKIEVLFVRHDDGKGTELENGTRGWQIYDEVSPQGEELIFEKHYNSAFRRTGLKEYLDKKNVDTIILVGLQTEYCIDATCKSAFDHDYKVIIPEETNTTFDNDFLSGEKLYEFYNYKIWNKRFAEVISVEDVKRLLTMPT